MAGWSCRAASLLAGYRFIPPRMIMSLTRPVTRRKPRSSIDPMSPMCSQPSLSMVAAVSAGML